MNNPKLPFWMRLGSMHRVLCWHHSIGCTALSLENLYWLCPVFHKETSHTLRQSRSDALPYRRLFLARPNFYASSRWDRKGCSLLSHGFLQSCRILDILNNSLPASRDYNQRVSQPCYCKFEITLFATSMTEPEQTLEMVEIAPLRQWQWQWHKTPTCCPLPTMEENR